MPPKNKKLFSFKILIFLRTMIMRLLLNSDFRVDNCLGFFLETYFNPNSSLLIFFLNWPLNRV